MIKGYLLLIITSIKAGVSSDIKVIIALSTISQLSYMFISLLINPLLTLFHIIIHALFKSLLVIFPYQHLLILYYILLLTIYSIITQYWISSN